MLSRFNPPRPQERLGKGSRFPKVRQHRFPKGSFSDRYTSMPRAATGICRN